MATANSTITVVLERRAVRHALTAERMRVRHYNEALASAKDKKLRSLCGRQLDASLGRAAELALALIDMGEPVPMTALRTEFDDRLLDAMASNVRNGDASKTARVAGKPIKAAHAGRAAARSPRN